MDNSNMFIQINNHSQVCIVRCYTAVHEYQGGDIFRYVDDFMSNKAEICQGDKAYKVPDDNWLLITAY